MSKRRMTIEDHENIADRIAIICHYIEEVNDKLQSHCYKTSPLMKAFNKILPLRINGVFPPIFGELENLYNDVVTDEEYTRNIYGNFEDRYQKIMVEARSGSIHTEEESD